MENNTTLENLEIVETKKSKFVKFLNFFTHSSKSAGHKIFKGFAIFLLYALATIGIVFGSINLEKENEKKGLFGESYTITYKLKTNETDANISLAETKEAAENFSNWLLYKGISNNGVSYEVKQETLPGSSTGAVNVGYLYVNFLNINKFYFDQTDEDVNLSASLVGFNHYNNSNIEVWQYNQPANFSGTSHESFYKNVPILSSSNFNYDSSVADKRDEKDSDGKTQNTFGVKMNLQGTYDLNEGTKFEEQAKVESYDQKVNGKLEWLVFQNMDGLINKLNYGKYVVINYREKTKPGSGASTEEQKKWTIEYQSLKQYDPDLVAWADIASFSQGSTTIYNPAVITKENLVKYYQKAAGVDDYASYPSDADPTLKTVVDKYLLGSVTKDNYKQWLPSTGTINFARQNEISIQKNGASQTSQTDLIYQFKNTILPVQYLQPSGSAQINNPTEFKLNGTGWISNPYIKEGVTKLSSYEAILLSLGVVLLLIAIVVSVLYRIPGLMGAFAIISSVAFSAGLLVLLNANFSIATVIGLTIGLILALICVSFSMERVRRLINQKNSIFDSIQTAIKKSMMTTVDINATTIILALSLFFFSKEELSDLGLSLVLTPLLVLGCTFLFFYFPLYIYSADRKFWNVKYSLCKLQTESKVKIWFNHTKWWIIWGCLLALVILGSILFETVGVHNASFNNGTIVYITGVSSDKVNQLVNAFGSSWYGNSFNNGVFEIISNNSVSYQETQKIVSSVLTGSEYSLHVSVVSPKIATETFISGIYGLLAGFGFSCIYYVVRANVLIVIPIFLVNCLTVLIATSFAYIVQLPISNLFVYAVATSGLISNIFACLFVSVIRTRFNRRKIFEKDKIELFIVNNLKSLLNTTFIVMASNLVVYLLLAFLVSTTTLFMFLNIAICSIIAMYVSYFLIAHMYYYVIIVRQLYINNIFYNIDNKINNKFVEVDEQLIYSINKFH